MGIIDRIFQKSIDKRITEIEARMMNVSDQKVAEKANELFENYMDGLEKSQKDTSEIEPKSFLYDPFSVMEALGYKERVMSVSYDTLRLMSERSAVVAAVINTRIQQVASFARKPETKYDMGYEVRLRDTDAEPTDKDKAQIKELEKFIDSTAFPQVADEESRDNFESFLAKYVRDSLVYDQGCFEVVKGRGSYPVAFYAIDSSTIRRATTPRLLHQVRLQYYGKNNQIGNWASTSPTENKTVQPTANFSSPYSTVMNQLKRDFGMKQSKDEDIEQIKYVQVLQGRVVNTYTEEEMAFGVRNPRTYLLNNGYGVAELEILISTVTAHLWAEEYNKRFFSQGSAPKGIIHFEGGNISQEQITAFRRQWHAQVAGVWNAWKTPIMSSPGKMQYQNLQMNNRQMEFSNWLDYLLKLICGVYLMDPSEINFDLRGTSGQTNAPMFMSSNESKQKLSKDRGLKPLLRFIENEINKNVIWKIDPRFEMRFAGLDAKTEKEIQELREKEIKTFKTIDEVRAEYDMDPIGDEKGGDLIMDPSYIGWRNQKSMADQQSQMMGQQEMGGGLEGGGDFGNFEESPEEAKGLDFGNEEDFGREKDFGEKSKAKTKEPDFSSGKKEKMPDFGTEG